MPKPKKKEKKTKAKLRRNLNVPSRSYLGSLELLVMLAISKLGKEAYGAGVKDIINKDAGIATHLGAVYTSLIRLENKGLIKSAMGEPRAVRGGRAKRFYVLTGKGQKSVSKSVGGIKKLAA